MVIVTPDWITQCITEKSLVAVESYHPSLLIDPKAKTPPQPPTEILKNIKIVSEKKEEKEAKTRLEDPKPAETKVTEVKTISDAPSVVPQPTPQQEVVNHTPPATVSAPSTTKNMRVASNLPPHLEQQLQQHSMMRNTAPRQQHQGGGSHTGLRMVRSGAGTAWRANQQGGLQRSNSQNSSEPRLQTHQGVRMVVNVQQIRGQTALASQQGSNNPTHSIQNQQAGHQQPPGMVRQVRLVNPASQAQQQASNNGDASAQQRGQAPNSFQQPQNRLPLNQSPQIVKMVVTQTQVDGKPVHHLQQTSVSSPMNQQQFSNVYSQNGQQVQTQVQQPGPNQLNPQQQQQQQHFQQGGEDSSNTPMNNNMNPMLRQQQVTDVNSYNTVQMSNNAFAQQQRPRLPISGNVQQQGIQGAPQQVNKEMVVYFISCVFYCMFEWMITDDCADAHDSTTTATSTRATSYSTTRRRLPSPDDFGKCNWSEYTWCWKSTSTGHE